VVGAEIPKAREPSERLWHVSVSSLAEEERIWFEQGCSCREDLQDMEDRAQRFECHCWKPV